MHKKKNRQFGKIHCVAKNFAVILSDTVSVGDTVKYYYYNLSVKSKTIKRNVHCCYGHTIIIIMII